MCVNQGISKVFCVNICSNVCVNLSYKNTSIIIDIVLAVGFQCQGAVGASPALNTITTIFTILQSALTMT